MRKTAIKNTLDYRATFQDLKMNIALNEISRTVEINGQPMDRYLESKFMCLLREHGARSESVAIREIEFAAFDNRYHPIKQYLNNLAYDGKNYIHELAGFFRADKFFEIWLHRWLIMTIGRVVNNAQVPVLILDGPQNIGKSLFVKWLASSPQVRPYYTEGQIQPDSKDSRIRATQKWIWEVPEFGATARRADVEALKGFITLSEVTERAPYQKADEKRPLLACFIGTINNGAAGFLNDPSGSRRFLVTHIDGIDWEGYTNKLRPDDIWAQSYAEYLIGEPYELTQDEQKLSEENNRSYESPDALLAIIESIYQITNDPAHFIPTSALIEDLQNANYRAGTTDALAKRVANTLTGLGLKKERRRAGINPNPVTGYSGLKRII